MTQQWIDVSDTTPRIAYTATASETAFVVPFVFFENSDLRVYQNGTLLTLDTDYNVTGAEESSGTVTLLTGATLADVILITRHVPLEQTTHIPPSGPLDVPAINVQISKLVAMIQQVEVTGESAVHFPENDLNDAELAVASSRANHLLGFGTSGELIYPLGPTFVGETATGVAHVDSRATAQVTTFASSVNAVVTSGYAFPGDGGGATYKKGVGGGSFADGGAVTWSLDLGCNVANVRWFGATGKGVIDDATAIQSAITAAQALGGPATVYIPSGNYACATGLVVTSSGITFMGDSAGASRLTATAAMTGLLRVGPASGATTRASYVVVKDLFLLGATYCSVAVFHFYNCIYSRFENLRIESGSMNGIQGDGNPDTTTTFGDPFTQGCMVSNVSVRSAGNIGHYYRGVKGSLFQNLESDGCGSHSFYWDMEQQTGGADEITENVITNCIAKNGGNAGYVFSGIAKHNISNIEAYICVGPGVLFQPTISGTNAPSFSNIITGLIVRNCAGAIATADGAGILGIVVTGVNVAGSSDKPGTGIDIKGWIRFALSNIVMIGVPGNNIAIEDDPSPPAAGSSSSNNGSISGVTLIGANQVSTQVGILIADYTSQVRITGVVSNQAGGSSGYEIAANSTHSNDVEISNFTLIPNTAAHELSINGSAGIVFHGANRTNVTGAASLWLPRGTPSPTTFAGQLYEDSGNSNKLSWKSTDGVTHVITTVP